MDNKIVTHSAEVLAAIENGMAQIEVYQADMTGNELRKFIALKHRYSVKNLQATYRTIRFLEDYLTSDDEGKKLAQTLKGTTRQKIASFLNTSDSTIKRVKYIGDNNRFDTLGLIEQGERSLKEVAYEIKLAKMNTKTQENKDRDKPVVPNTNVIKSPVDDDREEDNDIEYEDSGDDDISEEYYIDPEDTGDNTAPATAIPSANFVNGTFNIEGMGKFEISVTDNVPSVTINGKTIRNISYQTISNREASETGGSKSFILSQAGKNGLCIQLTVENISKAA